MERELVTEEQLLAFLNKELAKYEDSESYRFDSIGYRLVEPDPEGCNWSTPQLRGSGVPLEPIVPIAERIVGEARRRYNLR